jgi:hypothetical protein
MIFASSIILMPARESPDIVADRAAPLTLSARTPFRFSDRAPSRLSVFNEARPAI